MSVNAFIAQDAASKPMALTTAAVPMETIPRPI